MVDQWFYRLFGTEFGPVTRSALDSLIQSGQLSHSDEIRPQDSVNWISVRELAAGASPGAAASSGTVMSLDSLPLAQIESATAANAAAADQWHYQTLGQDWGPVTFNELLQLTGKGEIGPDDFVRSASTSKWRRAGSIGRLMAVMPYQSQTAASTRPQAATAANNDDELEFNLPQSSQPAATATPRRSDMPTPAAQSSAPLAAAGQPSDPTWFAWVGGKEYGPVEITHLMEWAKQGRISSRDYIRHGRDSQWTVVSSVPGLIPVAANSAKGATSSQPAIATKSTPVSVATIAAKPTSNPAAAVVAATATAAAKPASVAVSAAAPSAKPIAASANDMPTSQPVSPEPAQDNALKATETGMSSMTSFSGSSTSLASTFNRGPQPTKKWTPPGKGGKKSGGKLSGNVSLALLKDIRVLGAVGGLLLIVGLYFGWTMLPEGSGKFQEPYQQLSKIYKEIEDKAGSSPSEADWKEFGQQAEGRIKTIKDQLAAMKNSQHPVRSKLNSFAGQINSLLKKKPDELETSIQRAKKTQDEVAKLLGVSS